jgi:hypothetical protein
MTAPTLFVIFFVAAVVIGFSLAWGTPVFAVPIAAAVLVLMGVAGLVRRIRRPAEVAREKGLAPEYQREELTEPERETLAPGTTPSGAHGVRSEEARRLAEEHWPRGPARRSPKRRRSFSSSTQAALARFER